MQQARLNLLVQRGALADAEGYKKVLSLLGG